MWHKAMVATLAVAIGLAIAFTGQPFAGNQIPSSMITQQAQTLLGFAPLPIGRGGKWLSAASGPVDAVLGGWQVSGITTYGTGTPFSVGFSVPSSYVGWWGGRADRVGSDVYTGKQSNSHNITSGVQWFNPGAFAPPQPWTWGNSSRNTLFGPGVENWDISALKNFAFSERASLELRADFFDALNHFNLGNPSSTIPDTRDGGPPIPTTGKIYGGSGNRTIQIGLRLEF